MITRKTQRGILVLLVLTAFSFWVARQQEKEVTDPVAGIDPKLNYVLRDFELQFYDKDGQPTINMQAPSLRNDPELQVGTVEQPVIQLNQPNATWNLTSDSARVTADKEHVWLSGQVYIMRSDLESGNWVRLITEEIKVNVTPQTASTDYPVTMFDGYNQLNAIGLDLDMKTNTFKLKQKVKATYAVN